VFLILFQLLKLQLAEQRSTADPILSNRVGGAFRSRGIVRSSSALSGALKRIAELTSTEPSASSAFTTRSRCRVLG